MSSDSARWMEIEAAFESALNAAPAELPLLMQRLHDADREVHHEVQSLLAASRAAGDFLESSASAYAADHLRDHAEPGEMAGTIIGRYRLIHELGRGGMGTVWLAERADGQFEQRVALKLIKHGLDSEEILSRFLRERQILARLEHPNIARLLDGGVSDDGRPYFVMEFVAGTPITRYCDDRKLSVEARLRLFIAVCRAVQYAHRNLIVHSDIKPANVLLSDTDGVKLLDFGVAKLLSDDDAPDSRNARTTAREPITPGYASPEQLVGSAVNTASDVFQLGLLFCELLTGQRPNRGHHSTMEASDLRNDQRTIALLALHKDPEQRYPSAEALAEDVERYLGHLPLRFGERGWRYVTGKFVRRYRLALSAVAVVFVVGTGITAAYFSRVRTERDVARREADKATQLAATLRRVFRGWSADAADRGKVSAEMLLGDAARRARIELAGQPELLASTLSMLGDLESGIGQMAAADSLLVQALAIQSRLARPGRDLAATLLRRGTLLLESGRSVEAESTLRNALDVYRQVDGPSDANAVVAQRALAVALWQLQRLPEAESLLRTTMSRLADAQSPVASEIQSELGYVLFLEGRYSEAVAILRTTLASQRQTFGSLHASTLSTIRRLASSLRGPASFNEAEALDREALVITRALYGDRHVETYATVGALAVLLERTGNFAAADSFAHSAVLQGIEFFQETSIEAALMLRTWGSVRLVLGDSVRAEQLLRRAITALRSAAPSGHPDEGDVLNRLCYLLRRRHAPDADAMYQRAVRFERARSANGPFFMTDGYEYLGWCARERGDLALAEQVYRRALALFGNELPAGHPYQVQASTGLTATLLATGQRADATRDLPRR